MPICHIKLVVNLSFFLARSVSFVRYVYLQKNKYNSPATYTSTTQHRLLLGFFNALKYFFPCHGVSVSESCHFKQLSSQLQLNFTLFLHISPSIIGTHLCYFCLLSTATTPRTIMPSMPSSIFMLCFLLPLLFVSAIKSKSLFIWRHCSKRSKWNYLDNSRPQFGAKLC